MNTLKLAARLLLGACLIFAGVGHLTFSRIEFQAQVPVWLPIDPDFVVLASGMIEIILGLAIASWSRHVPLFGLLTAVFFVVIFPGNINQYLEGINAFGLNSDEARFMRLFFQPLLALWALWSTSAFGFIKTILISKKSRL